MHRRPASKSENGCGITEDVLYVTLNPIDFHSNSNLIEFVLCLSNLKYIRNLTYLFIEYSSLIRYLITV